MIDTEINIHVECGGIVPPEGVTMVPEDGELCACTENGVEAIDLDEIVRHYVIALRWSEVDTDADREVYFDQIDAEIADQAMAEIRADVNGFLLANQADVHTYAEQFTTEQIGHDLALTRNGHGAGFWDRGAGELGERLSEATKPMGEQHLYLGDDGLIYVM